MPKRKISKLEQILERERIALLTGDLYALEALIPEKEELTLSLEDSDITELKALSFKLAQNELLFAAARSGVEVVIDTLKKQYSARTALSTYDKSGNANVIEASKIETERRY